MFAWPSCTWPMTSSELRVFASSVMVLVIWTDPGDNSTETMGSETPAFDATFALTVLMKFVRNPLLLMSLS